MNKKLMIVLALLLLSTTLIGCHSENGEEAKTNSSAHTATDSADASVPFMTFKDQTGKEIVLPKKPERIVILNTELLQLFDQVGGKMVGRATAPDVAVPDHAQSAEDVGMISEVSLEKVLNLKPDLVIGQPLFHAKLADAMKEAHIPFAILTIRTLEDIHNNALLLGKVADNEAQAAELVNQMNNSIDEIVSKVPDRKPTYAILTFMLNTVSVQKSGSIAIDVADKLKMSNIADSIPDGPRPGSTPFSMEKLVELDPEYLFFVVHGTEQEGEQMLKTNLEANQAWQSLKAVKEKKYRFIPSSLFVNNPGLNMKQSFNLMAQIVYPDVFENQ